MPKSPDYIANYISNGIFIVVKGSKWNLYLTLARGRKIMAKVEEMMVVRARTTLTGTILQRVYSSEEQCFFQGTSIMIMLRDCALIKSQIKRVCISCHKCELATYYLASWLSPKRAFDPPCMCGESARAQSGNYRTASMQNHLPIYHQDGAQRLLSTTCFGPGNYRTARHKTLWVASAFSSF